MNNPSVVIVGSFNVDHIWRCESLPVAGATLLGHYTTGPGGKGFNQAVAVARSGTLSQFVCSLGEDAAGIMARQLSKQENILLSVQSSTEPTGTAGIYVDNHGRNSIVIGAGANASLSKEFITEQQGLIENSTVLLVQMESPSETIETAMQLAHQAGVLTVLNPAPANASIKISQLALTNILTPNESEFSALLARHVGERLNPDDVAATDGTRLHGLCRKLLPTGTVVITLGSAGVFVSHPADNLRGDQQDHYRQGAEAATVIDTTGAGDAFSGSLAASLAKNKALPFLQHIRFANRFAALSTEKHGAAIAMPTFELVQERFPAA